MSKQKTYRVTFSEWVLYQDSVQANSPAEAARASSDRPIVLYSLDVIISVGYRVKSRRGTQFRIWANGVLRDYLLRG